ncbi:ABC transporter permease [Streptomonospora sp. S1-112]|uniref:ABC transporter permease n=1 Tax=Streptomonospora mangrovi TaxID=2883123 RepID=A0A9X3SGH2_9ACTN|nr:ABC transporter permease [Streptomonospora mangrovi]MDA0566892.1 ABC transporter permease [Streptomonospora mangrovi]
MSQEMTLAAPAPGRPAAEGRPRAWNRLRIVSIVVAAFVALAGVRAITGQPMLTSSGTFQAALAFAVPIGLAGLGGLWAERAGIINIGLEGMMVLGTWFGAYFAFSTGSPWAGLVAGVLGGMAGGLVHALATVTFGVDHIISGVAINILAVGAMRYLSLLFFVDTPGGGASQSPPLPEFPQVGLPFVADLLAPAQESGVFLAADLAGLVVGLTTQISVLTLLALLLAPATFVVLWRTPFGLRLRSCGENPDAAESLGVPVYTYKFTAVLLSGGFAGMGGVFLAMVASSVYQEGQTGGRGYIGLAAMIFGNWRPGGLAMGAGLFGFTDALQVRGGGGAVHALLLLIAVALIAAGLVLLARALWRTRRLPVVVFAAGALVALVAGVVALTLGGAWWWALAGVGLAAAVGVGAWTARGPVAAVVSVVAGVLVLVWFLGTDTLPGQLVTYSPQMATLLVLALASQRLRAPAGVGRQWRRSRS